MKEFAIYTAARLGLFVLSYVVVVGVYLLVTGGSPIPLFWPFLVAVVISAVASVYLLRGQRERFALAVHERAERSAARRAMVRAEEERRAAGEAPAEGEAPGNGEAPAEGARRTDDDPGTGGDTGTDQGPEEDGR